MARLAFDLSVLRVLLVEDETFAREFEATALQRLGISQVTLAEHGAEALDLLRRGTPCDLIVSDWNMPQFDGLELLQAVRNGWPGIAFLMLTSTESLASIEAARDAGVDGYLIKPFSLDKLREALQLALISRVTGGQPTVASGESDRDSVELMRVTTCIRDVLDRATPPDGGPMNGAAQDANAFALQISDQLDRFVDGLNDVDAERLGVIRLHVDCMQAILAGRADLLEHETRNMITDGLLLVTDLASE